VTTDARSDAGRRNGRESLSKAEKRKEEKVLLVAAKISKTKQITVRSAKKVNGDKSHSTVSKRSIGGNCC
jgi:hypothetical protein